MYTIGSVPYVNARPLVRYFEEEPGRFPVEVRYDVPSRLPAMLDRREADAVMASSIESLLTPGRRIAGGLCIASRGPVLSVRLFSKPPIGEIRTLALDQSSLTSNSLAKVVLWERYGVRPDASPEPPVLSDMLANYDACVLIGDIGMRTDGSGLHVIDLGEEWTELTGLPFVWAAWIGGDRLDEELSGYLRAARIMSCLGRRAEGGAQRREHARTRGVAGRHLRGGRIVRARDPPAG